MLCLSHPKRAIGRLRGSYERRRERCIRDGLLFALALPSLLFRSFPGIFLSSLRSRLNKILVTHHFRFSKDQRFRRTAGFGFVIGLEQGFDTLFLKNAPSDERLGSFGELLQVSLDALLSGLLQRECIPLQNEVTQR